MSHKQKAPVFITIGPQLSGKKSFLDSLSLNTNSVSLNDYPVLIETINFNEAIHIWQNPSDTNIENRWPHLYQWSMFNVTRAQLLQEHQERELMLISLLFAKKLPFPKFAEKMKAILTQGDVFKEFIKCVEELYREGHTMKAPFIEIIVVNAVETCKTTALVDMKKEIISNPSAVCWRNPNLSPSFYKDVLQCAMENKRSVRFIRWGLEMPSVSFTTLMKRNILRFLETGRYVDTQKLLTFSVNATKQFQDMGIATHSAYAKAAGFNMDSAGFLSLQLVGKRAPELSTKDALNLTAWRRSKWSAWGDDSLVSPIILKSYNTTAEMCAIEDAKSLGSVKSLHKYGMVRAKESTTDLVVVDPSKKKGGKEDVDRTNWPAVIITVGPYCSGKSTYIDSITNPAVSSFRINEARGMYYTVPTNLILLLDADDFELSDELRRNLTLSDLQLATQIRDMSKTETVLLTLLFRGAITVDHFEKEAQQVFSKKSLATTFPMYMGIIRELLKERLAFCSQAVYIVRIEKTQEVALQTMKSVKKAIETLRNGVCWDTGVSVEPIFYRTILKHAARYQRQVTFVRYGYELPQVDFKTIMERNIRRFLTTGKLHDVRILERNYEAAMGILQHSESDNKLANMAGYDLHKNNIPTMSTRSDSSDSITLRGLEDEMNNANPLSHFAFTPVYKKEGKIKSSSKDNHNPDDALMLAYGDADSVGRSSKSTLNTRKSFKSREPMIEAAPVLITVGPQCCGTREFIDTLREHQIQEFSLDTMPGMYESVPFPLMCAVWQDCLTPEDRAALDSWQVIPGSSIKEKILELRNTEIMFLCLLFIKAISFKDFAKSIEQYVFDDEDSDFEDLMLYIECVRSIYGATPELARESLSHKIDIFIHENLSENFEGVSKKLLKHICKDPSLIIWNNTNLKPVFYADVLKAASISQRSVYFIRWGQELRKMSKMELLKKNLQTFLKKGRLVEYKQLCVYHDTAEDLLEKGAKKHADFAKLAGFTMRNNGTVYEDGVEADENNPIMSRYACKMGKRWRVWNNNSTVSRII